MTPLSPIGAAVAAARRGGEGEDGDAVQRALAGGPRVLPPEERRQPQQVASRGAADALADAPVEGPAAVPDDRETVEPETTA
eukprot:8001190-Pyramimonas_sp.AAC.1